MKKILFIDPADFIGGAELFLLEHIKKLNHKEFSCAVVSSGNKDYLEKLPANKCEIIKAEIGRLKPVNLKNLYKFYLSVKSLKKIIKLKNPDMVQTNSVRSHICGSIAARLARKKIIWYLHDFTFPKMFMRFLIRLPHKVITNSKVVQAFTKSQVNRKYHSKIINLPNGIDPDLFEEVTTPNSIKKELKLKQESKLVGIVGRIDIWKGQDVFLKAAGEVIAKIPEAKFLIIGDASAYDPKTVAFKQSLIKLANELNLADDVKFLGFRKDVYRLIKQLDILVHASTEPEPFGRVVIEAMALGTPVIAGNLGGPTEIIKDDKNGLLHDPKDPKDLARKIIKLLKDERRLKNYIFEAKKTVRNEFDIKKIMRRWEKIYNSIS